MVAHDAIVLAGGAARRLGGAAKPQVPVAGRRLLDHVLDATGQARRVVVVAPSTVPVPDGVVRTLEDPPLGGPVAGIAAGLAALGTPERWVVLLACDLPGAAAAVPRLLQAVPAASDGVVMRDAHGRHQWLLGVYAGEALRARVADLVAGDGVRGASAHALLSPLRLRVIEARADEARDIDTWDDLEGS